MTRSHVASFEDCIQARHSKASTKLLGLLLVPWDKCPFIEKEKSAVKCPSSMNILISDNSGKMIQAKKVELILDCIYHIKEIFCSLKNIIPKIL